MALPRIAVPSLLEQSGVTVTVTDEASGYPKAHLYDRDLAYPWKAADASGDKTVQVDQGSSGIFGVTMGLIAGHNMAGLTCYLEYSDDGSAWTGYDDAGGGDGSFTAAAGVIELPITDHEAAMPGGIPGDEPEGGQYPSEAVGLVKRYWRLRIISPSTAPEIGEFMLAREFEFLKNYNWGGPWSKEPNVTVSRGPSGAEYAVKRGESQRSLEVEITHASTEFRDVLHRREEEAGVNLKPFWFWDWDGERYWVKLSSPVTSRLTSYERWHLRFSLMEAN